MKPKPPKIWPYPTYLLIKDVSIKKDKKEQNELERGKKAQKELESYRGAIIVWKCPSCNKSKDHHNFNRHRCVKKEKREPVPPLLRG
jgi:hypothetical protein